MLASSVFKDEMSHTILHKENLFRMPKKEKKIAKRPVTVPQGPSAMEARAKEKELKTEARLN